MRGPLLRGRGVAGVVTAAILLAACSAPSAAPTPEEVATSAAENRFAACNALARDIRSSLQAYVDQFAPADEAAEEDIGTTAPSLEDLRTASAQFRERLARLGCRQREFQVQLDRALGALDGQGPLARAVVPLVRDSVAGAVGPPATVQLEPGDDLVAAIHAAAPDAIVELSAGRFEIAEPLLVLRGIRLRGAGSDATEIVSSAPGAVAVSLGDEVFAATGVGFAHEGDEDASVLVLSNGGYDLTDVAVRGGVAGDGSVGWGLVLGGAPTQDGTAAVRVESLDRMTASGNEAGGIVVVGDRAPVMTDVRGEGNGSCGVCWFGTGAGSLVGGTFLDNELGMSIVGGEPSIVGVRIEGSASVGMLVEGDAGGTVDDLEITSPDGALTSLGVRGTAATIFTRLVAEGGDQVAVLVEGEATPTLRDARVGGAPFGLLARGDTAAVVEGLVVSDVQEANVVHSGRSAGRTADVTCASELPGVVLLEDTTVDVTDVGCEVLDQRDEGGGD